MRSPPGGRPASPEPAPRRERDHRRPPAPCRPLRARPSRGRRARAAALAAPRWLHRAHPRAERGLGGVNPEVHGPGGRGADVRASGRAAGGGRRAAALPPARRLDAGPVTAAAPGRAALPALAPPGSARRCSRAGSAPARTPPPPTPLTSTASWSRRPGACHFQREPGLRAHGVPGLRGPGGVGPSSSARALRPAAARTHLPAAAPRRVIGCPRPARQIEPSIHSWAGRARAAATGLCPARAPPWSRARPPLNRRRPPRRVPGACERARAARPRCPPGGSERGPAAFSPRVCRAPRG